MRKVAITGGLSSGKSTVCRIFRDLGAYTISSDEIVHNLLSHDRTLQKQIINLLGSDILTNNLLDREKIAKKVFSDKEKLKALEALIHPAVFHEIDACFEKVSQDKSYEFFVAEVPLLFETQSQGIFDVVVTVLSEEKQCKERFKTMKNRSEAEFEHRMMQQISPTQKAAHADYIIINNGSLEELKTQVVLLSSNLRST